jgi:hypothetical protein
MAKQIHEFTARIPGPKGRYIARAFSEQRGNVWIGWLEFHPADGSGPVLATGEETSQPDAKAVEYWASGIEPVYLEGAIARARQKR